MVISKAIALISNDSGLMHMATAVKIPVLAIFGPSVKELGFFPYRSNHIVIENHEVSCRPCSHIGRQHCPEKHFKCMLEISPSDVLTRLRELLKIREI
jgi:heptosyltransferase-2